MAYTIIVILAVVAAFFVITYNNLVRLKNKCNEAWADIDTQLKRRYDLIPNLVETVKGYAKHESGTLEKVVEARTASMNAQSVAEKEKAENMLTGALKTIFALAENYPDLKANQNFMHLQSTLNEVEEHIQLSRRYYNATVRDFNTKIEVFPNNLIAGKLGFDKREFFQANESEKENVKVSFKEEEKPEENAAKPEEPAPAAEKPAEEAKPEEPAPEPSEAEKKPEPEEPAPATEAAPPAEEEAPKQEEPPKTEN